MKHMFPDPEEPELVGDVMDLKIGDDGIPVRVYVPEGEGRIRQSCTTTAADGFSATSIRTTRRVGP
ncbi:hypothetical protein [Natrinema soli]|uniref:Uncharacterized protein n=1 Tax=Natrinema soli TaxID=1930624 RepID=A0ABD5SKJ9_9EURY|nr:hypothetical protein [Natrinema soli]